MVDATGNGDGAGAVDGDAVGRFPCRAENMRACPRKQTNIRTESTSCHSLEVGYARLNASAMSVRARPFFFRNSTFLHSIIKGAKERHESKQSPRGRRTENTLIFEKCDSLENGLFIYGRG